MKHLGKITLVTRMACKEIIQTILKYQYCRLYETNFGIKFPLKGADCNLAKILCIKLQIDLVHHLQKFTSPILETQKF